MNANMLRTVRMGARLLQNDHFLCYAVQTGFVAKRPFSVTRRIYSEAASSSNEATGVADLRKRILGRALTHVKEHGWTVDAISTACLEEGYSAQTHGMFDRGAVELAEFFIEDCNSKWIAALIGNMAADADTSMGDQSSFRSERLHTAIKMRLEMILPYIDSWPQAMALLCHPCSLPKTLMQTGTALDTVWKTIRADTSASLVGGVIDQAGLAAIYGATELYMLTDNSAGKQATWDFLRRRLAEGKVVRSGMDIVDIVGTYARPILSSPLSWLFRK